jgi:RNA polymerase sigma-70 factor (ECF subfamily)
MFVCSPAVHGAPGRATSVFRSLFTGFSEVPEEKWKKSLIRGSLRVSATTDEELLRRAREGDGRAFDEFIVRESPRVHAWMSRAVGPDAADDLTQEIFLRAFRGLARYRGDAPARAWLAAIAHNAVKNRYRFLGRFRKIFAAPEAPADPPDGAADPESAARSSETRARVARALRELPEEYRMPIVLRDLEGWNYEEIAVSLRLPVGTVKSRIARGRGRLRTLLAPLVRKDRK